MFDLLLIVPGNNFLSCRDGIMASCTMGSLKCLVHNEFVTPQTAMFNSSVWFVF